MNVTKKRALHLSDPMRFSISLIAILFTLSTVFSAFYEKGNRTEALPASSTADETPTVILDAGHGGMDSGAVSIYGDEEKHLNLAVTKKIGAFLESAGIRVIYTRSEDTMVESEIAGGSRKNRDLMGRVEAARKEPDALFVSIHMNSFPLTQYHGLQVWCAPDSPDSLALASSVQSAVRESLQPDNDRRVKTAGSNIYLIHENPNTAILIECGFLSNPEECRRLSDENYRKELSFLIFSAIIEHLNDTQRS